MESLRNTDSWIVVAWLAPRSRQEPEGEGVAGPVPGRVRLALRGASAQGGRAWKHPALSQASVAFVGTLAEQ
eukprot:2731336-Alexandrium_andersonii.AAC.1